MRLREIIQDSTTVKALEPEELAVAMLRHLNFLVSHNNRHRSNRLSAKDYCNSESSNYQAAGQGDCAPALASAWEYLRTAGMIAFDPNPIGDLEFLTPRGRALKTEDNYEHFRKASLYPRGSIHPVIEQETYAEFLRGDYESAVFKAFKKLEVVARQHSGAAPEIVGVDLMTKAFNPDTGPLRDPSEIRAERKSLMDLYCSAIGRFKNPSSHREVDFGNAAEVIEILELASLLMRIIDRRAAAAAAQSG